MATFGILDLYNCYNNTEILNFTAHEAALWVSQQGIYIVWKGVTFYQE